MFEGFTRELIETPEAAICVRRMGSGPPLLLLHGYPQNHLVWHRIAPRLAEEFTVVWRGRHSGSPGSHRHSGGVCGGPGGCWHRGRDARGTGVLAASTGRRL